MNLKEGKLALRGPAMKVQNRDRGGMFISRTRRTVTRICETTVEKRSFCKTDQKNGTYEVQKMRKTTSLLKVGSGWEDPINIMASYEEKGERDSWKFH